MSAKNFNIEKINITSLSNQTWNIKSLCTSFLYYEDIDRHFVTATLTVIDSGINLINLLPIQGGETIDIEMQTVKGETIEYVFKVWKVFNRSFGPDLQQYALALVTEECLQNELIRISTLKEDYPHKIVEDLVKNYWKSEKTLDAEPAQNKLKFFPGRKTVSSLINMIQTKSLSRKAKFSIGEARRSEPQRNFQNDNSEEDDKESTGTAGYLFFENKNGFVFKSMDLLCAVGQQGSFSGTDVLETYYSKPITDANSPDNYNIIQSYSFPSEIDVIQNLRVGTYSTKMIFYNYSTGEYEEVINKLSNTFNDMVKLGNQDQLPKYQIQHESVPTRVISKVLDHETWNVNSRVADPVQGGKPEYPDDSRYLMAQGMSRRSILNTQQLDITIAGNEKLTVGEKVKVYLPNISVSNKREETPWDNESSGNYLIAKLSHNYMIAQDDGPKFTTRLLLIRDTYGMEDEASKAI